MSLEIGRNSGLPANPLIDARRPTHDARGAYTLLEICIVMCIIALVVGAAIPALSGVSREARLREPQRRLQLLTTTARRLAVLEGRPYEIELDEKDFHLKPVPGSSSTNRVSQAVEMEYHVPDKIKYRLLRLVDEELRRPAGDHWVFSPSGLCEPLEVQFSSDQSVLRVSFSPLTATVNEETCTIR